MKHFSAILTAVIITMVIGLGIVVIGVSALTNTNTVALQNSPNASTTGSSIASTGNDPAVQSVPASSSVQQLQQQVNDLQSQLSQAGQLVQQYQSILMALQARGVIAIDRSGNIYLPQGESGEFH